MPNQIHNLELCAWLRTATEGLCEETKTRVYEGTWARYARTLAVRRAEGLDEDEAHNAAIADLGDAKTARKLFQTFPSENLAHELKLCAWLRSATAGLCEVAKIRIYEEIRAHYAEAVGAQTSEGLDENKAHRLALEALGDAKKARKAFRLTYLTEKEAKGLASYRPENLRRYVPWLILNDVCILFVVFLLRATRGAASGNELLTIWAAWNVWFFVFFWLSPRLAQRHQWRRLLTWRMVAWVVLFAGMMAQGVEGFAWLPLTLLLLLCEARLWRKLGKNANLYDSLWSGDDEGGHYA